MSAPTFWDYLADVGGAVGGGVLLVVAVVLLIDAGSWATGSFAARRQAPWALAGGILCLALAIVGFAAASYVDAL